MEAFPDNLRRLLGVHALTAREAAALLDLSVSTFTKWERGLRQPSFSTALRVADFFGVPADRLATAEFKDLLQHELADPDRFDAVEERIQLDRARLDAARRLEAGEEIDIVTGETVDTDEVR